MRFIESAKFMASWLSNLVLNLLEKIGKTEWKDCDRFLEYEIFKDNLIKYKCLSFKKDCSNKIDEKLKNHI